MANEPRERLDKLRKAKVSGEPRKRRKAPPKEEETENPLLDDYTNDVPASPNE